MISINFYHGVRITNPTQGRQGFTAQRKGLYFLSAMHRVCGAARMLHYVRAVELNLTMLVFALDLLGLGFGLGLPIWASSAMLQVWVLGFRVFGLRVFGFGFFWVWGFWVQGFWLQGFGLQGFGVLGFIVFWGFGGFWGFRVFWGEGFLGLRV